MRASSTGVAKIRILVGTGAATGARVSAAPELVALELAWDAGFDADDDDPVRGAPCSVTAGTDSAVEPASAEEVTVVPGESDTADGEPDEGEEPASAEACVTAKLFTGQFGEGVAEVWEFD